MSDRDNLEQLLSALSQERLAGEFFNVADRLAHGEPLEEDEERFREGARQLLRSFGSRPSPTSASPALLRSMAGPGRLSESLIAAARTQVDRESVAEYLGQLAVAFNPKSKLEASERTHLLLEASKLFRVLSQLHFTRATEISSNREVVSWPASMTSTF